MSADWPMLSPSCALLTGCQQVNSMDDHMRVLKPCLTLFNVLLIGIVMEAVPHTVLLGIIIIFVHHATEVNSGYT